MMGQLTAVTPEPFQAGMGRSSTFPSLPPHHNPPQRCRCAPRLSLLPPPHLSQSCCSFSLRLQSWLLHRDVPLLIRENSPQHKGTETCPHAPSAGLCSECSQQHSLSPGFQQQGSPSASLQSNIYESN